MHTGPQGSKASRVDDDVVKVVSPLTAKVIVELRFDKERALFWADCTECTKSAL
jgi:hypothetical protein